MGDANGWNDERPLSKIKTRPFWMGRLEITNKLLLKACKKEAAAVLILGDKALPKLTVTDRKELKLASWGNPQIIIEDYNGNFRIAGFENGMTVSVGTASGGTMGEFSGYNLEATGEEVEPAHFIDPTIIGDDTNTTVVEAV